MSTELLGAKLRLRRVQHVCEVEDVSVLLVLGIDGRHNRGADSMAQFLLLGATGSALTKGDIDEEYDFLEECVFLVQRSSISVIWNAKARQVFGDYLLAISPILVQYTYSPEEESDTDLFQMRKCVHFKRMVLECLGAGDRVAVALPAAYEVVAEMEAWPLIQSFALNATLSDGSESPFNTGFFTSVFTCVNFSAVFDEIYGAVDLCAIDSALSVAHSEALKSHRETLQLTHSFFSMSSTSKVEDVASPLELLYDYASMRACFDDEDEVLKPCCLVGTESSLIGAHALATELDDLRYDYETAQQEALRSSHHFLVEGALPGTGLRWCRTYFTGRSRRGAEDMAMTAPFASIFSESAVAVEEPTLLLLSRMKALTATLVNAMEGTVSECLANNDQPDLLPALLRERVESYLALSSDPMGSLEVLVQRRNAFGQLLTAASNSADCWVYVRLAVKGIRIEGSSLAVAVGDTFLYRSCAGVLRAEEMGAAACVTRSFAYSSLCVGRAEEAAANAVSAGIKIPKVRAAIGLGSASSNDHETLHASLTLLTNSASLAYFNASVRAFGAGFVLERIEGCPCLPMVCAIGSHVKHVVAIDAADVLEFALKSLRLPAHSKDFPRFSDSGFFVFLTLISKPNTADFISHSLHLLVDSDSEHIDSIGFFIPSDTTSFMDTWRHWKAELKNCDIPLYRKSELRGVQLSDGLMQSTLRFVNSLLDASAVKELGVERVFNLQGSLEEAERSDSDAMTDLLKACDGDGVRSDVQVLRSSSVVSALANVAQVTRTQSKALPLARSIVLVGICGSGVMTVADQMEQRLTSIIDLAQIPLSLIRLDLDLAASTGADADRAITRAMSGVNATLPDDGVTPLFILSVVCSVAKRDGISSLLARVGSLSVIVFTISVTNPSASLASRSSVLSKKSFGKSLEGTGIGHELVAAVATELLVMSDVCIIIDDDIHAKEYAKTKAFVSRLNSFARFLKLSTSATWLDADLLDDIVSRASNPPAALSTFESLSRALFGGLHKLAAPLMSCNVQCIEGIPCIVSATMKSTRAFSIPFNHDADVYRLSSFLQRLFPKAAMSLSSELHNIGWYAPASKSNAKGLRRLTELAKAKLLSGMQRKESEESFAKTLLDNSSSIKALSSAVISVHGRLVLRCKGFVDLSAAGVVLSEDRVVNVEANASSVIIRLGLRREKLENESLMCIGCFQAGDAKRLDDAFQCCLTKALVPMKRLTKDSLLPAQLELVQKASQLKELPPEWAFDGQNYVSFRGESKHFRPDILELSEEFISVKNCDVDSFNSIRNEVYGVL